MSYVLTVSTHAYNRMFNDRLHQEDIINFMEKCIKSYELYDKSRPEGFYRLTDDDTTIVIKKDNSRDILDFIAVTLYNKHDKYTQLVINVLDFRCYYEGKEPNDRNKERISRLTVKKKKYNEFDDLEKEFSKSYFERFRDIITNKHERRTVSKSIQRLYPEAIYVISPIFGLRSNKVVYITSEFEILAILSEKEYMQKLKTSNNGLTIKKKAKNERTI